MSCKNINTLKTIYITVLLTIISIISFSQRNAPVAGDAAKLTDLLKKDYNAIDPELKQEEIARDRTTVIAIFKSYLESEKKADSDVSIGAEGIIVDPSEYTNYIRDKQNFESFKSLVFTTENIDEYKKYIDYLETKANQLQISKENYYNCKFEADTLELGKIKNKYNKNKYITQSIQLFLNKYKSLNSYQADQQAAVNHVSSIEKSIPFIGGDLNFEMLMQGLSRFLAKRIKEELTTHFINKIKEWLQNPDENDPLMELEIILPRTTEYLLGFQADQVTSFTDEMKQYIEDDLNHFLENASNLKNSSRLQRLIQDHPDIEFAFEALELIPNISNLKHPVDYFKTLEASNRLSEWKKDTQDTVKHNLANMIYMSSMLAHSLTIIENKQTRFVGNDFLGNYMAEKEFYLLYAGFLYQQNIKYYEISFLSDNDNISLSEKWKTMMGSSSTNGHKDARFLSSLLQGVGKHTEMVHNNANEMRKANKTGKEITPKQAHEFVGSVIDLTEGIVYTCDTMVKYIMTNVPEKDASKSINLSAKAAPYFTVARTSNDVLLNLKQKEYALAIIKMLEMSGEIYPENESYMSDLLSLINKLNSYNPVKQDSAWRLTIKKLLNIKKDSKNSFNAAVDAELEKIIHELNKIILFHENHYKHDIAFRNEISSLKEKIFIITNSSTTVLNESECTAIKNLLGKEKFHRLIISYYANIPIDSLTNTIISKLQKIEVNKVPLYSENETIAIKELINNYINSTYLFYVLNEGKNKWHENNKKLETLITNQLSLLPQKLDLSLHPKVLKVVHFLNDIAAAESEEDVADAIENIALPAGSYSIKRTAKYNISLNSYPGILAGMEVSWKNKIAYGKGSFGFTAPVGLSFTWGGSKKGHSNGVYLPIIDLAAFTRFRLDDDTSTVNIADFNFRSVFSPGLYYHHGLGKTPLSLHFGAQYGPQLKEIKADGNARFYESMFFGFGLVLDIPIINIYTKPRFD